MDDYERECSKRKARAKKFGTTYLPPKLEEFIPWSEAKRLKEQPQTGFATGIDMMDSDEVAKRGARMARFANPETTGDGDETKDTETTNDDKNEGDTSEATKKKKEDLSAREAWDKEELLRPQRSDPPPFLWKNPGEPSESAASEERRDASLEEVDTTTTSWAPEKLHLFAIDWAAFKQLRNKDIMAFFTGYGPTYVEWLADLSCNVHFEDKYTATRAMMTLAQEIPSLPPSDLVNGEDQEQNTSSPPDFGNMHWKFCRKPIRKLANDKYGKRGTTARVLMRLALSSDILQVRPNSWPAPPGGFSKTKVLGPKSDYKGSKKLRKKRSRGLDKAKEQQDVYLPPDEEGEHPLLDRGLSSGRQGGFSLEELEQERAKKKTKTSELCNS